MERPMFIGTKFEEKTLNLIDENSTKSLSFCNIVGVPFYIEKYDGDVEQTKTEDYMPVIRKGTTSAIKILIPSLNNELKGTVFLLKSGEELYNNHLKYSKVRKNIIDKYDLEGHNVKGLNRKTKLIKLGEKSFEI